MERRDNRIMNMLESFRMELAEVRDQTKAVELYQAFDRLFLDYQEGRIDSSEAENRLNALKAAKDQDEMSLSGLRIEGSPSLRQRVMLRNHEALAERLLSMPRGSWNRSHVEVVQQAISVLNHEHAASLSYRLQQRLSDSIWAENFELADTVSTLETERASFERMLEALVSHTPEQGYEKEDGSRELASDIRKQVVEAVSSHAYASVLRAQEAADKLSVSEAYMAKLASESRSRQAALSQSFKDVATRQAVEHALDAIHHAGDSLVNQEIDKLRIIQGKLMHEIARSGDEHIRTEAQNVFGALSGLDTKDVVRVAHHAELLKNLAQRLHTEEGSKIVSELGSVVEQTHKAQGILDYQVGHSSEDVSQKDDERALLEAHMMYAQHRMKYEQTAYEADRAADLLKALDADVSLPEYTVRPVSVRVHPSEHSANRRLQDVADTLKRVQWLAQSERFGDSGFYAPYAGAENTKTARASLQMADRAVPMFTSIPTIHSAVAKRSNQLMRQIRQLAYLPSVRNDMGFGGMRLHSIDEMSERPLFKRVKFDARHQDTADMLPALYRVAGMKMKTTDTPLRKSSGELDLNTSNYEIIKMIEHQFGNMKTRMTESVGGILDNTLNRVDIQADNPLGQATGVALNWIRNRKDKASKAADTQSLIQTGRLAGEQMVSNLKSEAMSLPKEVQKKLSPFLGFDISNIKIYSGPIAEMASTAMGAEAFTLGKSIFLGKKKLDFGSPEGLALLAHELLHTSHFNSGDSVNLKEQAAEDIEARVRKAFGASTQALALEKKSPHAKLEKTATASLPADDGFPRKPLLRASQIFDEVSEIVLQMLMDDVKKEKQGNGCF